MDLLMAEELLVLCLLEGALGRGAQRAVTSLLDILPQPETLEVLGSGWGGHPIYCEKPLESSAFPLSISGIAFYYFQ